MTRVALVLVLASGCKSVKPCEPWVGWELTALSDAPGERIEGCTPTRLTWRVIHGGSIPAWLDNLESMQIDGAWRLHRRSTLVRPGAPGVSVVSRNEGNDLVITLDVVPSFDVEAALRELPPRR